MRMFLDKIKQLPKFAALTLAGIVAFIGLVYYPVGMIIVHHIDDSAKFSAESFEVKGGSHAVAMAEALIDREVNKHHWAPSDPFFYPGAMLTRMPAFQRGIQSGIARFAIEMSDHVGRTRGTSQADPDLQKAAGLLNYSPSVWMFDFSTSWLPTASSPTQYRSGMEALRNYNKRLGDGRAVFERRADNLMEMLTRMANDFGSASAALAEHIESEPGLALVGSADLFYSNKGRLYVNYLLMRELEKDFAGVIKEKQLESAWKQTLESLREGMDLSNLLILNASPGSQFFPNHLAVQGFYLMRARTQMYEIINILLK